MKALFTLILLISFIPIHAQVQDPLRTSMKYDTTSINTIKLNLDKYNKVRQRAFTFAISSGICGAVAIATSANDSNVSLFMADAAAVLGIVSFFTFNHADKYMRKISMELSPGKLLINF